MKITRCQHELLAALHAGQTLRSAARGRFHLDDLSVPLRTIRPLLTANLISASCYDDRYRLTARGTHCVLTRV